MTFIVLAVASAASPPARTQIACDSVIVFFFVGTT